MTNQEMFSAIVARVFIQLIEAFPLVRPIDKTMITLELLDRDDLWREKRQDDELEARIEIALTSDFDITEEEKVKLEAAQTELDEKRTKRGELLLHINAIYDGSLTFLLEEGYVRAKNKSTFQLTSKGFSALGRDPGIAGDSEATFASKIAEQLNPVSFVGSITSGSLVALIARLFAA